MKLLKYMRDGGTESKVDGYWLIEAKSLFSVALLHFHNGSREAYHSHAFNCISWVLRGQLNEDNLGQAPQVYKASLRPVLTYRNTIHMVKSTGDTWVLTFRGPWSDRWSEFLPALRKFVTLTHGRKVVGETEC